LIKQIFKTYVGPGRPVDKRLLMIRNPVFDGFECKCCGPVAVLEKHVIEHVKQILKIRQATGFPRVTEKTIQKVVQCFVASDSPTYHIVCNMNLYNP
jgi:hypothetical protein